MAAINVNGQTINLGTSTTGYVIANSTVNTLTFTNNVINSAANGGYMLDAGDELAGSTNNNLDGAIITGNKFNWTGTAVHEAGTTHTCFVGYNKNVKIKYNYLSRPCSGFQLKAAGMADVTGCVAYNIIKQDTGITAIPIKGMKNTRIYNNTFYTTQSFSSDGSAGMWRGLIEIYANTDEGQLPSVSNSSGTKIKNNIFYTTHQVYNIRVIDSESLVGFESDYNIFYCTAGTPLFLHPTLGSRTFAQWQAAGFDTHSVVVNPNFVDFTNFIPTARLNYGTNLLAEFQDGLSTTATWTLGSAPAVATQNGTWQVGARVFAAASGPEWYVATAAMGGNDSNPGTFASPFLTIQKGINTVTAGGTVWIRGGTYTPTAQSSGWQVGILIDSSKHGGSSGNPTKVFAYNNEDVIVNGANLTSTTVTKAGWYIVDSNYWHIKGVRVTNVKQFMGADGAHGGCGWNLIGVTNITLENCSSNANGGYGFGCRMLSDYVAFVNCDSYNNYDPLTAGQPGGDADGYDVGWTSNNSHISFFGCRSWDNSDDGFDMYQATNPSISPYNSYVTAVNCWAWRHGWKGSDYSALAGDGTGFKPGPQDTNGAVTPRRTIHNCISAYNRVGGFNQNEASCAVQYENCISYGNFNQSGGSGWWIYRANTLNIFRNNVAAGSDTVLIVGSPAVNTNNSWTLGLTPVAGTNFISTDYTELARPRKVGGALPDIDFLKPVSGSVLRNKGTTTGQYATDGAGNAWAATPTIGAFEYTGTVPNTIPTVVTNNPTAIANTTATGNGNVTADGGNVVGGVTARGVCWSISANPTIANSVATGGSGTGVFTAAMTGLVANTQYYVRAYATNGLGTAYGANIVFTTTGGATIPVLTTTALTAITSTTASSGGTISSDGGASITSRGVVWGLWTLPETQYDTYTVNGTGTGVFTSAIIGLLPNTSYFIRAYAINSAGIGYGNQFTFVTTSSVSLPSITTTSVTNITLTTATVNSNLTNAGGGTVTEKGFVWGITSNPTIASHLGQYVTNGTLGVYAGNVSSATPNTLYYVRSYAINEAGTVYGNQLTFTTLILSLPTITTTAVTAITSTTASSGGNITSDGGAAVTVRGVVWSTTTAPTIALSTKTSNGTGTGVFTSSVTGLTGGTSYYIRAYATNSVGTVYGNEIVFVTTGVLPTVIITSYTTITTSSIIVNNNVTSDGGSAVTSRGIVYDIAPNPTTSNFVVTSGSGTGAYTTNITGLSSNTTYYMRAFSVNSVGTSYSPQNNFITSIGPLGITISNTINHYMTPIIYGGYGALYNGFAVSDSRNIAPVGWHVPTNAEFNTLRLYLDQYSDYLYNVAGGPLKSTNVGYWASPNTGASNSAGFDALGGGTRDFNNGSFSNLNNAMIMWSSTLQYGMGITAVLGNSSASLVTQGGANITRTDRKKGLSVRLIKDDPSGWSPGFTVTGNDGRIYNTIQIGTQVWTKSNIWETKYRDGSTIPIITDPNVWVNYSVDSLTTATTVNGYFDSFNSGLEQPIGQTFNITDTKSISVVDFTVVGSVAGTPDLDIRACIYSVVGGLPDTLLYYSTNTLRPDAFKTTLADRKFFFNYTNLTAGDYAIVLVYENTITHNAGNYITFPLLSTNPYAGGMAVRENLVTWYSIAASDIPLTISFSSGARCYYNNDINYV